MTELTEQAWETVVQGEDGGWFQPTANPFGHGCCDCGLAHQVEFAFIDESGAIVSLPKSTALVLRFTRDPAETARLRAYRRSVKGEINLEEADMSTKFEQWAIVEVMGHQRLAGKVTEQSIGGASFVRVDVPGVNGCQAFTKLLGSGAIYAITIVDAETARAAAGQLRQKPMDEWSARQMLGLPEPQRSLYDPDLEEEEPECF